MTRPTTLKLHDFSDESFINGCYMPDHICDDLVKYFDENPDRYYKGGVYGIGDNSQFNTDFKASTEIAFYINQDEEDAKIMSEYIMNLNLCIREYEYKYERVKLLATYAITEGIQIQKYEPSEGYKAWHCERYGIAQQTRCFAFMTYLNDVPDGGGTEFAYYPEIKLKAKKGLTILWPTDFTHTHRGIISQHEKWIITGWFHHPGVKETKATIKEKMETQWQKN